MKEVSRFVAEDGKEFSVKEEALRWDERIIQARAATEAFREGATFLEAVERSEWAKIDGEEHREILNRITRDTKLIISYLQGRDTPGYKVTRFDTDGSIGVYGDAGSWSGPYGSSLGLFSIIIYAKETFAEAERRKP